MLLMIVTAAVFSPVLRHHFIQTWDDRTAILANPDYNPPRLHNLVHYWTEAPAKGLFYVPVTYTLWGLVAFVARHSAPPGLPFNPAWFYALNLAAHAVAAGMVYLVLAELVDRTWTAWIGAAWFALNPIQVEAVANAWSMYTPLSAALAFFAIWQYLRGSGRSHATGKLAWGHYAAASVAFGLALLTKPTVAAVPIMIALIELGLRGRRWREILLPLAPWIIGAIFVVWINQRNPATGRVFVPDPALRIMVPMDALTFYAGKVVAPVKLCMDYGRTPYAVAGKPALHWTCVIAVALIAAAWFARRRWPAGAVGFGLFAVGLVPVSGIVPFTFQYYSTVADRYVYLAMLGPALMIADLIRRVPRPGVAGYVAACGVLALLAAGSVIQLRHWRDDWHLAAYTLDRNPHSLAAVGTFMALLPDAQNQSGATAATPLPPVPCTLTRAELVDAGDALARTGTQWLAAGCYRRALDRGPATASLYSRLGAALAAENRTHESAAAACREALRLDPNDVLARRTLDELASHAD